MARIKTGPSMAMVEARQRHQIGAGMPHGRFRVSVCLCLSAQYYSMYLGIYRAYLGTMGYRGQGRNYRSREIAKTELGMTKELLAPNRIQVAPAWLGKEGSSGC